MKKISTILVAMIMMVVSLAGCGGSGEYAGTWAYKVDIPQVDANDVEFTMEASMSLLLNEDDTFSFIISAGLTDDESDRYAGALFDYIVSQQSNEVGMSEEELVAEVETKMGMTKEEFKASTIEDLKGAQYSDEITGNYTVDGDQITLDDGAAKDILTIQDGKLKLESGWEYSEEVLLERE